VNHRYEGWDDSDTLPGMVRRFDKSAYRWVVVEKRDHRRRWAHEHLRAEGER